MQSEVGETSRNRTDEPWSSALLPLLQDALSHTQAAVPQGPGCTVVHTDAAAEHSDATAVHTNEAAVHADEAAVAPPRTILVGIL